MSKFGAESEFLRVAALTGAWPKTLREMRSRMVPAIQAAATSQAVATGIRIWSKLNFGQSRLLTKMGGGCPSHSGNHGNATNVCPIQSWPLGKLAFLVETGMCAECRGDTVPCACVPIPLETFQALVNATDSLSFLNGQQNQGAAIWLDREEAWTEKHRIQLTDHFGITAQQANILRAWLQSIAQSTFLEQQVLKKLNTNKGRLVRSWEDIVLRQWLYADVLAILKPEGGASFQDVRSIVEEAPPELAFYLRSPNATEQDRTAASLWNLTTVSCAEQLITANASWSVQTFLNQSLAAKMEDFTRPSQNYRTPNVTLGACFPDDPDANFQLITRFVNYLARVVVERELSRVTSDAVDGGLVITRTVEEHALGFRDPILELVLETGDPRYRAHALLVNDPDLDAFPYCRSSADVEDDYLSCQQVHQNGTTRYLRVPSTFATGKDNVYTAGQLIKHRGVNVIQGMYSAGPMQIEGGAQEMTGDLQYGFSVGTQFPPFAKVSPKGRLALFVSALTAPFMYTYNNTVKDLWGIQLYRFILPYSEFTPDRTDGHLFMQTTSGIINVTESKGFPLYISNPHFLGFHQQFPTFTHAGIASASHHTSFIDVEPITGKTMRARIQSQIVVPTDNVRYDSQYPNVHRTPFLPVFWREVVSQLSEEQAQMFVKSVYGAQSISTIGVACCLVVGSLLVTAGVVMLWNKKKKSKEMEMEAD